jgi:hypothetical protein
LRPGNGLPGKQVEGESGVRDRERDGVINSIRGVSKYWELLNTR